MKKLENIEDGRKLRWFDCDWNNNTNIPNGCGVCRVCKYLSYKDWAESVSFAGSSMEYNQEIENYLKEPKKFIK